MSAHHFIVDDVARDEVTITGDEGHHAVRVLRIRSGEHVTLSDGRGAFAEGTAEPASGSLVVHVSRRREVPRARPSVHVFCALPKAGKLELVVQKLTEIGVASITPWSAARSVARWDEDKARAHVQRLRSVARAAAQQARAAWMPAVEGFVAGIPAALPQPSFVLHEGTEEGLLRSLPGEPPDDVALVVGPEGGLEETEIAAFSAAGARAVGLGPQILRAETAAIVGSVLVLGHYHGLG